MSGGWLTLKGIRRGAPRALERFAGKPVLIWSGEHRAWWRSECRGYTLSAEAAGIYSFEDAFLNTRHCGPEKQIAYCLASSAPPPHLPWRRAHTGSRRRGEMSAADAAEAAYIAWEAKQG